MNKPWALLLALLFTAAANLHLCASPRAPGEPAAGRYALPCALRGLLAAQAAADELLLSAPAPPTAALRLTLSLRPPSRDAAALSDWLLRRTEGLALMPGAYVNGMFLGCVRDRDALTEALRRHLYGSRPPGAVTGRYTEQIELRPVYSRPDRAMSAEDVGLLISGLSPVIYTDSSGRAV